MSGLRKRSIVAIARHHVRPSTQEDVGSFETRTAVFDENTPVGLILDWATPYKDSPRTDLTLYEDESTPVSKPSWIDTVGLHKTGEPRPVRGDEAERIARLAFGRQLCFWPPRNDEDVSLALVEFEGIRNASARGHHSYVDAMKPELKKIWYRAAEEFLDNPAPQAEAEEVF